MERKDFLKLAGCVMAGTALLPFTGQNAMAGTEQLEGTPLADLQKMIDAEVKKVFNSSIDPSLVQSRWKFAESYEVMMNENKTTAFDCADEIIEMCNENGFDASALRGGELPKGLKLSNNKISYIVGSKRYLQTVSGLADYDATVKCNNTIIIGTKLSPGEWSDIKRIKKVNEIQSQHDKVLTEVYEAFANGEKVRIWKSSEIESFITVDRNPSIKVVGIPQVVSVQELDKYIRVEI